MKRIIVGHKKKDGTIEPVQNGDVFQPGETDLGERPINMDNFEPKYQKKNNLWRLDQKGRK